MPDSCLSDLYHSWRYWGVHIVLWIPPIFLWQLFYFRDEIVVCIFNVPESVTRVAFCVGSVHLLFCFSACCIHILTCNFRSVQGAALLKIHWMKHFLLKSTLTTLWPWPPTLHWGFVFHTCIMFKFCCCFFSVIIFYLYSGFVVTRSVLFIIQWFAYFYCIAMYFVCTGNISTRVLLLSFNICTCIWSLPDKFLRNNLFIFLACLGL